MPILFCSLELYLPYCHSLKEKRRVVKGVVEKLRNRLKCAVCELEHQDAWQRARLGVVTISSSRMVLDQISERVINESERLLGGDLVDYFSEIIEHDRFD